MDLSKDSLGREARSEALAGDDKSGDTRDSGWLSSRNSPEPDEQNVWSGLIQMRKRDFQP